MNNYNINEIYVGLKETFNVIVNQQMVDLFVSLCGDTNPLHTDFAYAQSKGFLNKVVHGLLSSSFYSKLVGVYLPGKNSLLHGIDVTFRKPVFVGDKLSVTGKVSYINLAYRQIEVDAFIENQNCIKVSKAVIKTGLIDE